MQKQMYIFSISKVMTVCINTRTSNNDDISRIVIITVVIIDVVYEQTDIKIVGVRCK